MLQILVCKTTEGDIYAVSNINYETNQLTYVEKYHDNGDPYVHKTVSLNKIENIFWRNVKGDKK